MSTPVEKVKERLGIVEVVESYMKLDRAGSNLKGKCPFHNEKSPSFFVSPDRGTYYCFGCGAKGDIFSFVQQFEGLDFMGSLKLLAQRAGVELTYEKPEVKSERERFYAIMEEAAKHYEALLHTHQEAMGYIKGRGLTDETIKEFRIGFAPEDWRIIYTYLKGKKYTDADIEKVGLTKKTEKGYYDRFRGRIMFPICDSSGRVIAFTGRILKSGDDKIAKYLNSPETPLFNKAHVLYAIDKAKLEIRKRNFTILVEGQMDTIMSHQAGFKNTVAGSGTALTDTLQDRENVVNNLGIVKRISSNIIMVYDSDKAGMAAAERSAQIALSLGMDVKLGSVPEGKDPADLIVKDKEAWKEVIKNAKHVIEFILDNQVKTIDDPRKLAKAINEKVLPFVATLSSRMERAHFVSMISARARVPEEAVWEDLKAIDKTVTTHVRKTTAAPQVRLRKDVIVKKIFGVIFFAEERGLTHIDREVAMNKLREVLAADFEILHKEISAEKDQLVFETEVSYGTSPHIKNDLDEMLLNLEEDALKERLTFLMHQITAAEKLKDADKAHEILANYQSLSKRLGEITKEKKNIKQIIA